MKVSRSGFYDYRKRHNCRAEDPSQASLKARVRSIFNDHKGNYGSRRILKQLRNEGHQIGRYKVRSLMRKLGLKAKSPRRYKVTTDSRHSYPLAANLLDREFDVSF
jgi:transposase InsO family protein